jgi:hypothetical protein
MICMRKSVFLLHSYSTYFSNRYEIAGMGHRHLTPRLIVNLLIGDKRTCGVGIKLKGSGLALYLPSICLTRDST